MGAVNTTYTFTATDTITSAKMNNIIDETTLTSDAIIGTTLEVASGKLKVRAGSITSNELATNAVTTTGITDLNVTTGKLADLGITAGKIANDAVTTAKVLDANITPAKLSQPLTLATAQASTSGTSIDFTSIPSWVKRITVMFDAVSTNGTSPVTIQLGDAGGFETSGYNGTCANIGTSASTYANISVGFNTQQQTSASVIQYGIMTLSRITGNTWTAVSNMGRSDNSFFGLCSGAKTLSDVITQVRITTVGGVNAFDAGTINIMYE